MNPIAQNFIISRMEDICSKIPSLYLEYFYDPKAFVHVILSYPDHIFFDDPQFQEWETIFWDDFFSSFPDEEMIITNHYPYRLSPLIHSCGICKRIFYTDQKVGNRTIRFYYTFTPKWEDEVTTEEYSISNENTTSTAI